MKKIITLLPFLLFLIPNSFGQMKYTNPFQKDWDSVDNFISKGLPQSAQKKVQSILKKAQAQKDIPNILKAQRVILSTQRATSENGNKLTVDQLKQNIAQASGVEKAYWQAILANYYYVYFDDNRYSILGRTDVASAVDEDFEAWSAQQFVDHIIPLYHAALNPAKELQAIPAESYTPLLTRYENVEAFQLSLYDVFAYSAISFFKDKTVGVTQPLEPFNLSDGSGFLPTDQFVKVDFSHSDSSSFVLQTLLIYQELLRYHLAQTNNPQGLAWADYQRLKFVYEESNAPQKDSLYLVALNHLIATTPKAAVVGQLLVEKANFFFRQDFYSGKESTSPFVQELLAGPDRIFLSENGRNLPGIRKLLVQIKADYPNSKAGTDAAALIQTIDKQMLSTEVEETYLPNEPIKALLNYRNLDKVYVRVYQLPINPSQKDSDFKTFWETAKIQQTKQSFVLNLKGAEDLEAHSTEFKIDALPSGAYRLVFSAHSDFNEKDSTNYLVWSDFQVSRLALISSDNYVENSTWQVLDRKNGQPVVGAQIHIYYDQYNSKKRVYDRIKHSDVYMTDASGFFTPKTENRSAILMIVKGADTFTSPIYLSRYGNSDKRNETNYHTFIFTDRSIYRPGQTIFFKGIRVANQQNTANNQVVANQSLTVTFRDANYQKIEDAKFTTNEFGSFFGSFKAPDNGLTGSMSLQTIGGDVYFSVEEYKRPKFFVDFKPVEGNYALNQEVEIKGNAEAYAGNKVDGAKVVYTIQRRVRYPFFWAYYYYGLGNSSSSSQIIGQGTTETAADGSFTIKFTAQPDLSVDPKTLPVFDYEINADVTDINGETHSGSETVRAGYRSLQIVSRMPEQILADSFKNILVTTQNLNNVFVPTKLEMTVYKLQFPGRIYRSRIWDKPDQPLYSETEFHQLFPMDEYNDESDYRKWDLGEQVSQQSFETEKGGKIALNSKLWKEEGWYAFVIKGKDQQGQPIEERKFVYVVVHKAKSTAQKPWVLVSSATTLEPGQDLKVWLNTGFTNPYLLQKASTPELTGQLGWNGYRVKETDRGGMGIALAYFYENRLYQITERFDVPWTNKELNIEWATHRDKMLPGAKETWTMTIKGDRKEHVAAELLAGMYDASLDALKPQSWSWQKLLPYLSFYPRWQAYEARTNYSSVIRTPWVPSITQYDQRFPFLEYIRRIYNPVAKYSTLRRAASGSVNEVVAEQSDMMNAETPAPEVGYNFNPPTVEEGIEMLLVDETANEEPPVQIRKNLQETAFFFPDLRTDAKGNVVFSFEMPEALTEWRLMAFAHTKDWKTGYLEGRVKTQKDLMVQPNLPRFLRQGDDLELSTKIANLSDKDLTGTATLEILNAQTLQPMNLPFRLKTTDQPFTAATGQSTAVSWLIHVPEAVYEPVIIRIVAKAGNFSDGEENPLPVISNRMLVTETLALPIKGSGLHDFSFEKLLNSGIGPDAKTLVNHRLTLEFTGNPAWYAVQALPYLAEYPYECSEQTFSRFYANALAQHIVQQSPKIEKIFREWENKDTAALLSNLEKNQELKSALLEETPWVLEAKSETEQKHRIAKLFETHLLAKELDRNLKKLSNQQSQNGGFPWFPGMYESRYITQYILTGFGKLQDLGVQVANNKTTVSIIKNGLSFVDEALIEDYNYLVQNKKDLKKQNLGQTQIQYLYLRSFFLQQYPLPAKAKTAFDYFKGQMAQYWNQFNPYMEAMIALSAQKLGAQKTADAIMASLLETAVHNDELGMYWKENKGGYFWYQSGIEAQSMLISAFTKIGTHPNEIADMKTWLLKNKQTSNWQTTTATADAIYALLLSGQDWLAYEPKVVMKAGAKTFDLTKEKTEAGTGYFKTSIAGLDVRPEMGNISVTLEPTKGSQDVPVSWGAAYWQYFQDMDKISSANGSLQIEKELFIQKNTDKGPLLTRIKDGNQLEVGSKVVVRIILKSDRDLDYVHLKDMRAATFEPVDVLSGYHYQNGQGYYQSTRDVSTNFFFDRLKKGTYVLEYTVFVGQKGEFSNGISTVQCMYAPEFSAHSKGIRVKVE